MNMKMRSAWVMLLFLSSSLLPLLSFPNVEANNSTSTAWTLSTGYDYEWVCYDDECDDSGNYGSGVIDQHDYWKVTFYQGDYFEVTVYNYCNPHSADISLQYYTPGVGWNTAQTFGCNLSRDVSRTVSGSTYGTYYFDVKGIDGWLGDATDYRIHLYLSTTNRDQDRDGYIDSQDDCDTTYGTSDMNGYYGCPDADGDGYADFDDDFPNDSSEWLDSDNDGYGNNQDDCDTSYGTSDMNGYYGCPDADGDGYADFDDDFPNDSSEWLDSDNDGYGNNQDDCSSSYGTSDMNGIYGCPDSDGDGYANTDDDFPNDSSEWRDSDNDGYGNNQDDCDSSYGTSDMNGIYGCPDSDGDGYANTDDEFPNDASEWNDQDGDGVGDNSDNCNSEDASGYDNNNDGCIDDSDNDGHKDNVDQCPFEDSRGYDQDGDGCIDDSDNDGYKDDVDQCPNENSQGYDSNNDGCIDDSDDDGYKDNVDNCVYEDSRGYDQDGDGCIDDSDNDGVKDDQDTCANTSPGASVDQFGCSADQMDGDHDGVFDEVDDCPSEDASGFDQNQDGCIDDTDSDGFKDDVDDCSNEDSRGYDQDGDGCIDDSDGDGAKDNVDQCEGEDASGYDDNNDGCIDDSDGDGVNDKIDQCEDTTDDPNDTSITNAVDQYGCGWTQRDDDSDGVMNADDECPNDVQGNDGVNGCPATDIRLNSDESSYIIDSPEELVFYIDITNQGTATESVTIVVDGSFLSPYGVATVDAQMEQVSVAPGQTIPIRITLTLDAISMSNMPVDAVRTSLFVKAITESDVVITSEITIDFHKLQSDSDDPDMDGVLGELDDCPGTSGTSNYDRVGCPDTDDDGWSDPDGNWLAHPDGNADAFPDDSSKWRSDSQSSSVSSGGSSLLSSMMLFLIFILIAASIGAGVVIFRNKNRDDVPPLWGGAHGGNSPLPSQMNSLPPPNVSMKGGHTATLPPGPNINPNILPKSVAPAPSVGDAMTMLGGEPPQVQHGSVSPPGQYTDEQLLGFGWTTEQIGWHREEQALQAQNLNPAPQINLMHQTTVPVHICTLCQGRIKQADTMHTCAGCGKPFHISCSDRIPTCPQCGTPM